MGLKRGLEWVQKRAALCSLFGWSTTGARGILSHRPARCGLLSALTMPEEWDLHPEHYRLDHDKGRGKWFLTSTTLGITEVGVMLAGL